MMPHPLEIISEKLLESRASPFSDRESFETNGGSGLLYSYSNLF